MLSLNWIGKEKIITRVKGRTFRQCRDLRQVLARQQMGRPHW